MTLKHAFVGAGIAGAFIGGLITGLVRAAPAAEPVVSAAPVIAVASLAQPLTQADLANFVQRMDRLENHLDRTDTRLDTVATTLARVEGRLDNLPLPGGTTP